MTAVAVKWTATDLTGFWFMTNFLREEGLDDFAVKKVMDDLTEQYEKYRGSGRDFGPIFKVSAARDDVAHIEMLQPITEERIGDIMFNITERGDVNILPF